VQARATRDGIEALLAAEVAAGGPLTTYATYQEGTAVKWLRENCDLVLAPYVKKKRR